MKTSWKSVTLAGLSALCLSMAIQPAMATVITLTGGDAGEGLTLDPALVVAAKNINGATATLQGVSVPTNPSAITISSTGTYVPVYVTPPSPTPDDTALATLLNAAGYAQDAPLTVNITGLLANVLYKVNLLIADNVDTRNLAFSFNSDPAVDAFTTVSGSGYNVENLVQSTAGGAISVAITSSGYYSYGSGPLITSPTYPILSTAIVSAVPEPSTLVLAGMGIAFVVSCREFQRRRRVN